MDDHELIQFGRGEVARRGQEQGYAFHILPQTGLYRPSSEDLERVLGQFVLLGSVGRRQRNRMQLITGLSREPFL